MSDKRRVLLEPGYWITDPAEAEALGLNIEARDLQAQQLYRVYRESGDAYWRELPQEEQDRWKRVAWIAVMGREPLT